MKDKYYTAMKYFGSNGEVCLLRIDRSMGRRPRWDFKLSPAKRLWFCGYKNKFDALLAAAHMCKKSGEKMNWSLPNDR